MNRSFAGEIGHGLGLEGQAVGARHHGKRSARFHNGDHLRPIRDLRIVLRCQPVLDRQTCLLASLGQKHDHVRRFVLGERGDNAGIRRSTEDAIWVADKPDSGIFCANAVDGQTALRGRCPSLASIGGAGKSRNEQCSAEQGAGQHGGPF